MKPVLLKALALLLMQWIICLPHHGALAQDVLFDFDNAPYQSSLPITQTVNGITAVFNATGQGYSIQSANTMGFTPTGFSGLAIYPNSINLSDLLIKFNVSIVDFSIMYAAQELGCDDAETMRATAYKNGSLVGTNTRVAANPGTWPVDVLTFSSAQGFDSVVVHYDKKPPTCQDYGVIFMADNMRVTASTTLPVVLDYFNCEASANSVTLKWQAAEESNLDSYIPEYSREGISFSRLEKIRAQGSYQVYQFVHYNVSGTAYYRLKIVDKDGSYKYSETRKLFIKVKQDLTIIPNPATDRLFIYSNNQTDTKTITIISDDGTVVKTIKNYVDGQPIIVGDLPNGSYLIKAHSKTQSCSARLIKI
ncbi:MAG: T9SS type A sorting domain-containing protein [Flavisolibacter sp.]